VNLVDSLFPKKRPKMNFFFSNKSVKELNKNSSIDSIGSATSISPRIFNPETESVKSAPTVLGAQQGNSSFDGCLITSSPSGLLIIANPEQPLSLSATLPSFNTNETMTANAASTTFTIDGYNAFHIR
jgi:hypothetical protein